MVRSDVRKGFVQRGVVLALAAAAGLAPAAAGAQTLGTFRWQLQPYCNVLTLTVTQLGTTYRVEGTDDLCGHSERASAQGMAFLNPGGTVGFGLTIVAPGAAPLHVSASISPTSYNGTWHDDTGNAGGFIINGAAPGTLRPTSSQTRIAVAHTEWQTFTSADPVTVTRFSSNARFQRTSTGNNFLISGGSLPVVVNGRRQRLMGLELCYVASASARLTYVEVNTTAHTPSLPIGRTLRFTDLTTRTDATCRYYPLAVPYVLTANDAVNVVVQANWTTDAAAAFELGRTTWVLEPWTTMGVPDPAEDHLPAVENGLTSAPTRPGGR